MELSVVIVSYNVRYFLEECLKSVIKASRNLECEIIVVDNNSADGSCSMVSRVFPGVKLISNPVNAGFSAACNQGISVSTGEFALLLNPDTVVEEAAFARCISFMKKHPDAGALGVKMINRDGKVLPESKRAVPTPAAAFFKLTGLSRLLPRSGFFNRYYLGHIDGSVTTEAEVISGAYMFLRKASLERTGNLDESFFMYGEDIDLSYRLLKAGFKNYYFPEVRIIHYKGESTVKGDFNTTIHFYRAMLIFIRKHFSGKKSSPYLFLIRCAIYFLGFVSVLKKVVARYLLPPYRKFRRFPGIRSVRWPFERKARTIFVGSGESYLKLISLLSTSGKKQVLAGRISVINVDPGNEVLGGLSQIDEIIKTNGITRVIFSAREMSTSQLIDAMQIVSECDADIKISHDVDMLHYGSRNASVADVI